MGIDLTLLPIREIGPTGWFSQHVLRTHRWSELYGLIRGLPSMPVAESFDSYVGGRTPEGEHAYGNTQEDCYGDPVRWVLARDLWSSCAFRAPTRATTRPPGPSSPSFRL
jgi:hypothetical protein